VGVRRLLTWGFIGVLVTAVARYRKGRLDEADERLGIGTPPRP
jgi:hypothetical protein